MLSDDYMRGAIRTIWFLLVLGCGIVMKLIAKRIGNPRLSKLLFKVFIALGIFFVLLVLGVITDRFFGFSVPLVTSGVNLLFWAYIFTILTRFCWRLYKEESMVHKTDGATEANPRHIDSPRVSQILNELFDAVTLNKARGNRLEKQMSRYVK